jgi:hypothetical protein
VFVLGFPDYSRSAYVSVLGLPDHSRRVLDGEIP